MTWDMIGKLLVLSCGIMFISVAAWMAVILFSERKGRW